MTEKIIWVNLVLLIQNDHVLLARKTRKIGKGKWNGWGGKVEVGKTIRQSAIRELKSESGLIAREEDIERVGIMTFVNTYEDRPGEIVKMPTFILRRWTGFCVNNDEMQEPKWFPISDLPPWSEFLPADEFWLPHVLTGRRLDCVAKYGLNQTELLGPVEILFHN